MESIKTTSKIVVWVRFSRLPMELYHETFLRRAGAMIGIVLKIDKLTLIHSRGKFARICVEVDLKKKLVSKISKGEYLLCQV